MSFTDAPEPLGTLRTEIAATAAWTALSADATDIHYPVLARGDSPGNTFAILRRQNARNTIFADGVTGLFGGDLTIYIFTKSLTCGALESLASTLSGQLTKVSRIPNMNVDSIDDAEPATACETVSGDDGWLQITITLSFGLEA